MLNNLVPSDSLTLRIFGQANWEKQRKATLAMDEVNKKFGRNTVHYWVVKAEGRWQTKAEHRSSRYTTRLDELALINMDAVSSVSESYA